MSKQDNDSKITETLTSAKDKVSAAMINQAHKSRNYSEQETVFTITFSGEYLLPEDEAIENMATLLKQGKETTRRLLKKDIVLKTFDNKAAAERFLKTTRSAGIACNIVVENLGEEVDATLLEKTAHKLDELKVPEIHIPMPREMNTRQRVIFGGIGALIAAVLLYLLLAPPVIEGNSFATYSASVDRVLKHASEEQRPQLKKAIDLLTGAGFEFHKNNTSGANEEVASGMVYSSIAGMNAGEILEAAEARLEQKRTWFREAIEEAAANIADYEKEIRKTRKQNQVLEQFVVEETQYRWPDGSQPSAMLKLTNKSETVISRVFFEGLLYDGDKLIGSNPFSYAVAVGLQPGRHTYVTIFSRDSENPWALEAARGKPIRLEVEVHYAEDLKGNPIGTDVRPFLKRKADEEARKKRLEKELADIRL